MNQIYTPSRALFHLELVKLSLMKTADHQQLLIKHLFQELYMLSSVADKLEKQYIDGNLVCIHTHVMELRDFFVHIYSKSFQQLKLKSVNTLKIACNDVDDL